MAKIVYITNGMASTLNSSFELSRRLTEAGHVVVYASHADVGASVEARGYDFHPLEADREFASQASADAPPGGIRRLLRPLQSLAWLRRNRRRRLESAAVQELERLLTALDSDLVIVDIEMHVAVITIATLGIPMVLVMVWFSIFRDTALPPMHTSLIPGPLPSQRMGIRLAWIRTRWARSWLEWRRRLRPRSLKIHLRPIHYSTVRVQDLQTVARIRGFDFGRRTDRSHWLRPCLYPGIPLLSFNVWEMEFPHERHANLHYVGPMVARDRSDDPARRPERRQWSAFHARRGGDHSPGPLIYCSLGSFWSADRDFLDRIVDVFRRRPEWSLVLGLGGKLSAEALVPVPDNVLCLDWAPQLDVLANADCAITHGGITSINECLTFGVPLVVYSTKHVDQNGCAARVAFHGVGIVADKDVDSTHAMERNIERALNDPEIRQNVEAMRDRVEAYDRSSTAVDTIERYLAD